MSRGFQGALMRGLGSQDHEVTVVESFLLAPKFLRVRMNAPGLLADLDPGPAAYLRFWFPDPEGSDTEFQRGFTLTEWDRDTGDFAVDFVLHDPPGPATVWAQAAGPGTTVPVSAFGSKKFTVADEVPAGYLLIGDAASIPAINGILGVIPAKTPVEVVLEWHDEDDRLIPVTAHPRARVRWVPRGDTASLSEALEARDWSNWYAWAAAELGSIKQVRNRLRKEFGFPKSEVHAQGYWMRGSALSTLRRDRSAERPTPETSAAVPEQARAEVPSSAEGAPAEAPSGEPVRGAWKAQAAGRLIAPLRPTLMLAGLLQALVTLVQLAPFVLLVELSRRLLDGAGPDALRAVGVTAPALLGAGTALGALLLLWLHGVDARFARGLRERLLGKLARLPLGWFTARGSGAVKQLVQDDTLALHYLITHAVPDAVAAAVAPIAVLAYLFWVDWRIALALLIPVLVYIVTMAVMTAQSGAKIAQAQRWAERMNGEAAEYLRGQPVIRVFGAAAEGYRRSLDGYIGFLNDWRRPFIGKKTVMDLATRQGTFLWLIAVIGTPLVVGGRMDPVDLLPFLLLGTTFGARLLGVGYGLGGLRDGLLAARRVQVALDEPELAVRDVPDAPGEAVAGLVEFDRVTFGYQPGVPVIHDVSLTLEPGTVTALVGPSGSGKSTLAALLARFHDVGSGAIRVGGGDLRGLTSDELYTRVGFVLQDPQLVHGTVRENIALAVPDADRARIERAARDAHVHERILRLPQGYDTVLGPDAQLSGGERQRLTIARAILADTPVLVLDEATAFADPESEYLVQRALTRLTRGRTVLVIAHRLHTITGVDRIVVLDHGRVVEAGPHTALLVADGRYRRLWRAGGHGTSRTEESVR
ncbi:ATP-binding cassette subfamily B protein IrtA [Actinocorallia herbida]|uniref:Mycobactin import ATP-binding/permease protein IrtA n=1 Tax=Actinocorallia herbida TaxID=58109 RepID=A0A3N1CX02_9ACTN|nr:SIP domain-containing protein [Actinocorallia herbida]ROO85823.1 ATP-binding cassette subfamily B protein IrtA [Actinocorallia herbida]